MWIKLKAILLFGHLLQASIPIQASVNKTALRPFQPGPRNVLETWIKFCFCVVINVDQYEYICYLYCNTTSSAAPPTGKWFKCQSCAITRLKFASGRMLQIKHSHRFYIFICYCSTFHILYRSWNSCLKDLKYCHELISGRCWKSCIFLLFWEN